MDLQSLRAIPTRALQRALDGLNLVALDDVALLDVLVIREGHAAFLSRLHFADFVLEALEGGQLAFVNHHIVADETDLRAAPDQAFRHAAARDLADLGD